MLREDQSGISWVCPMESSAAEQAATESFDWYAALGIPSGFMSRGPLHSKNEVYPSWL